MRGRVSQQQETIRLHQANERTMLAWVRTGIAFMAFGFAIARFGLFFRQIGALAGAGPHAPTGLESGWLGTLLVALGVAANVVATVRYAQTRASIERGDVGAPSAGVVYVIGGATALIGLLMALLLLRATS